MNVEIGIEFGGSGSIKEYHSIAGDKLFRNFLWIRVHSFQKSTNIAYTVLRPSHIPPKKVSQSTRAWTQSSCTVSRIVIAFVNPVKWWWILLWSTAFDMRKPYSAGKFTGHYSTSGSRNPYSAVPSCILISHWPGTRFVGGGGSNPDADNFNFFLFSWRFSRWTMPLSILVYYRQKSIILKKIYKNSHALAQYRTHTPCLTVLPLYPCTTCAYTIRKYLNIVSNGKGGPAVKTESGCAPCTLYQHVLRIFAI